MCGVSGFVGPRDLSRQLAASICCLEHRGPDGMAVWNAESNRCGLGHTRLTILDLSTASSQPFVDSSGRYSMVFNGEIYNYLELRAELAASWKFNTSGDTEVLLAAFCRWGEQCVEHLNGMFAFAVWDEAEQSLFAARDRLGEKPFYYSYDAGLGEFVFASEIHALGPYGVDLSIRPDRIVSYLTASTTSNLDGFETTPVWGAVQLLPGSVLSIKLDRNGRSSVPRLRRYWAVEDLVREAPRAVTMEVAAAEFFTLFEDSVRLRLRADVPIGTSLSGGLDSSGVLAMMRRLLPSGALQTFTGRFEDPAFDEGPQAAGMAQFVGATAAERFVTPAGFLNDAATFYRAADLPVGGLSQYAQFKVFEMASQHGVKVLLDGQGSDEVFCGYGHSTHVAHLESLVAHGHIAAARKELATLRSSVPGTFGWKPLPKVLLAAVLPRGLQLRHIRDLLVGESRSILETQSNPAQLCAMRGRSALRGLAADLTGRTMLQSLLRYGDRLSMRHGLEVRLPFCDHRLVEFGFGLPADLLVGGGTNKRVVRSALSSIVPEAVVKRNKRGFNPPAQSWLLGPLRSWAAEMVHSSAFVATMVNVAEFDRLLSKGPDLTSRQFDIVWRVVNVAAWDMYRTPTQVSLSPCDVGHG